MDVNRITRRPVMAWNLLPRRSMRPRELRNTAPGWKKAIIVISAPITVAVISKVIDPNHINLFVLIALVVVAVGVVMWGVARLLGVHLSFHSWD
jgi:hypothetical protein